MHDVVVFSKPGCHLCEKVIAELEGLKQDVGHFTLNVKDITTDTGVFEKYFLNIPVVQVDGKDVFEATNLSDPEKWEKLISYLG